MDEILKKLILEAKYASEKAYAPYSNFKVGASLLTPDCNIIKGCNVENSSFGLTICAERNAVFTAITLGYKSFKALAIYTHTDNFTFPCGACRQVLAEFSKSNLPIYLVNKNMETFETNLDKLLPYSFEFRSS